MADSTFEFTDTSDCTFIDWDCVWSSWVYSLAVSFAFVAAVIEQLNVGNTIEQLNVSIVEN